MPSVYAVDLACKIINQHFGKPAEVVTAVLLKKGRLTFQELLRNCSLFSRADSSSSNPSSNDAVTVAPSTLKQVLLVLIQQNCVRTWLQPAEVFVTGTRPAVHLYEADLHKILWIIRRPKYLQHIRDDTPGKAGAHTDVSSVIIEVLLEHGRLRHDQITSAVVARLTQDAAAATAAAAAPVKTEGDHQQQQQHAAEGSKAAMYAEAVKWSFVQLLQERYIERAPPCNLPPPQTASKAVAKGKKSAPKPGSAEYAEAQSKALQQLAHKTYEESRFRAPKELVAGTAADHGPLNGTNGAAAADSKGKDSPAKDKPFKKRKKVAGGISADAAEAAAAAAAAAASAERAIVAKQAAELASKKKKTDSGKAIKVVSQDGVVVKQEDGGGGAGLPVVGVAGFLKGSGDAGSKQREKQAARDDVDPPTPAELLWRVNAVEFNRRFRNQVMVELVSDKLGADSGTVVAAMLAHARRYETGLKGDETISMSLADVSAALQAGQEAGRLPPLSERAEVDKLLNALSYDSLGCVNSKQPGPTGASFTVGMAAIMHRARLLQLHAVLKDKFGIEGLRIFQTLIMRGHLEQKHVADNVMLPHKEARELMYQMFRAGFLLLQDIPRTADRAPARCFYTWHVDEPKCFARLTDDLFHAAVNLHARRTFELDQHAQLVELVEAARAAGALTFNLTDSQRQAVHRLNKVTSALDTCLLRLDSMVALFSDY